MSAETRKRFAETVRSEPLDLGLACLLVGGEVEPDLDVDAALATLDALAASLELRTRDPAAAVAAMRGALGGPGGFAGTAADYEDLRSSLLHEVLRRRRGLPLLLSIVWLEVARRREIPAFAAALPGHVVVGVGDVSGEHVLADPFHSGRGTSAAEFGLLDDVDLLLRLLTNVRVLMDRAPRSLDTVRTRLWAVELSLLLPRHPVALRRERGQLLVRLGDHLGGAAELESYARLLEEAALGGQAEEEVEGARRDARQARARLN